MLSFPVMFLSDDARNGAGIRLSKTKKFGNSVQRCNRTSFFSVSARSCTSCLNFPTNQHDDTYQSALLFYVVYGLQTPPHNVCLSLDNCSLMCSIDFTMTIVSVLLNYMTNVCRGCRSCRSFPDPFVDKYLMPQHRPSYSRKPLQGIYMRSSPSYAPL
jgi:hypothetical protein